MSKRALCVCVGLWGFLTLVGCSQSSVDFYVVSPESMKKHKVASFYGTQAKKNCETYRRISAGLCDLTTDPFITCFDLDMRKYNSSRCE
jgi:hypothetical protein